MRLFSNKKEKKNALSVRDIIRSTNHKILSPIKTDQNFFSSNKLGVVDVVRLDLDLVDLVHIVGHVDQMNSMLSYGIEQLHRLHR
jgi:hypothetical protein